MRDFPDVANNRPKHNLMNLLHNNSEREQYENYLYRNIKKKVVDKETGELIGYKTQLNYSASQHLEDGLREYRAENFKFVNPDNFEVIGNSIDEWLVPFSQRVKVERQLANYIIKDVAPYHPELFKVADNMLNCRQSGAVGLTRQKDDGHIIAWDNKCNNSRLCPHEAGAEAKRLERSYAVSMFEWKRAAKNKRRFQKAVFTIPNVPLGGLHEAIRKIHKDFDKLRRRKCCRSMVGTLTSMESPLSDRNDWNVHLNVLMGIEGDFDWKEIQRQWSEIVDYRIDGVLQNLQIDFKSERQMLEITKKRFGRDDVTEKHILMASIRECIKYPAKHVTSKSNDGGEGAPAMVKWPPEVFIEFYEALKRYKRTRSHGAFYFGKNRIEHEKIDFNRVQWAGNVNFDNSLGKFLITLAGRPVSSIQGDNLANSNHQKEPLTRRTNHQPPQTRIN